jgi:hypothetical protein
MLSQGRYRRLDILPRKGGGLWTDKTPIICRFFETMSKRRRGFPSEERFKRGRRSVHDGKELVEKVGRHCTGRTGGARPARVDRRRLVVPVCESMTARPISCYTSEISERDR